MLQTAQTQTEPKTLQMEERQCAHCTGTFRVLTTSPQAFCSRICQDESLVKSPKPKKKKPWESLERDKLLYGEGQKTKPSTFVPQDLKPKPKLEPVPDPLAVQGPIEVEADLVVEIDEPRENEDRRTRNRGL